MGGTLGKIDLRPPEDFEAIKNKLTVFQDALQSMMVKELILPGLPKNGYRGELPGQITALDDERLGDLLEDVQVWTSYVEAELAKADAARDEARSMEDAVRARIRLAHRFDEDGKRLTVQDKNDLVETDPRVIDAVKDRLYAEAVYTLTKSIAISAQRGWDTISRRITQRGQEVERMKREGNVAGVPVSAGRVFRRPGDRTS